MPPAGDNLQVGPIPDSGGRRVAGETGSPEDPAPGAAAASRSNPGHAKARCEWRTSLPVAVSGPRTTGTATHLGGDGRVQSGVGGGGPGTPASPAEVRSWGGVTVAFEVAVSVGDFAAAAHSARILLAFI